MQKFLQKLFTNDVFFAVTSWITILLTVPFVIVVFFTYEEEVVLMSGAIRLSTAICLTVAYLAYRKHSKNVMKGMIGAVLMGYLAIIFSSLFAIGNDRSVGIAAVVFMVFFTVNHYIINGEHHSNPIGVYINQFLGGLFAILLCAESAMLVPDALNEADRIVQILMCVGQPCAIFCILCIETRLDAYKFKREKAELTEK